MGDLGPQIDPTTQVLFNRPLGWHESVEGEVAGPLQLGNSAGHEQCVHGEIREFQIHTNLAVAASPVDFDNLDKAHMDFVQGTPKRITGSRTASPINWTYISLFHFQQKALVVDFLPAKVRPA